MPCPVFRALDAMNGADRQWELNRQNFAGRWEGPTRWYGRDRSGSLDLQHPELEIPHSCYAISFEGPDTGLWHGRGLRFAPGGERRIPLSRQSYNQGGHCWQFEGAGGQSSLKVPSGPQGPEGAVMRFGHEFNFFRARSRSMLIALWLPHVTATETEWRLDQLAITPFRCTLAVVDPPRAPAGDAMAALQRMEGWSGQLERLEPGIPAGVGEDPRPCSAFRVEDFARHPLTAGFEDGLVASLPEVLPSAAFRLEVGALLEPGHFTRVSVLFDGRGELTAWERRQYSP